MSRDLSQEDELAALRLAWSGLKSLFTDYKNAPPKVKVEMASNIVYNVSQTLGDEEAYEAVK